MVTGDTGLLSALAGGLAREGEAERGPASGHHVVEDQVAALAEDVARVRTHPLIPETVRVGGFLYDVDTGLLDQQL